MTKIYQNSLSAGKNAGFTLIELLVVVLIIGILAAVALPQYQVAVGKSRVSQMLPFMTSVKNAQEVYYMANGVYSEKWEDLDVTIPLGTAFSDCISGSHDTQCVTLSSGVECALMSSGHSLYCQGKQTPRIGVSYNFGANNEQMGSRLCFAYTALDDKICKALGGKFLKTEYGQNRYSF